MPPFGPTYSWVVSVDTFATVQFRTMAGCIRNGWFGGVQRDTSMKRLKVQRQTKYLVVGTIEHTKSLSNGN